MLLSLLLLNLRSSKEELLAMTDARETAVSSVILLPDKYNSESVVILLK